MPSSLHVVHTILCAPMVCFLRTPVIFTTLSPAIYNLRTVSMSFVSIQAFDQSQLKIQANRQNGILCLETYIISGRSRCLSLTFVCICGCCFTLARQNYTIYISII